MGDASRIAKLRDAAGELFPMFEAYGEQPIARRLEALSSNEFDELCVSFRKAEVLTGMRGYLKTLLVCLVSGGALVWSSTRTSEPWVILLMLTGVVLILVALCLDVVSYVDLEKRCVSGLGMRVSDVVFGGVAPVGAVRDFRRSLGDGETLA